MTTPLIFGRHDENTLRQIQNVIDTGAAHFVECADGHLGYGHPIGGVAAYRDHISLSGVGFDIGCGNTAVRTDLKGRDVTPRIDAIMDEVARVIPFGIGRNNSGLKVDAREAYPFNDRTLWEGHPLLRSLRGLAESQLGTVGSGNHYVDVFVEDATDDVWVGVHFGSRGFGHKIATHYMEAVGARDDMMGPPALLEAESDIGREYIHAMTVAGKYARAGRMAVVRAVVEILGAGAVTRLVDNHHNFAWREEHFGEMYWVVRKGATPAFPGQEGFVGGSMGDDAVIVEGVDSELSRRALYSTVHGAGRVMSRSEAKGKVKVDRETGEVRVVKEPRVSHLEAEDWLLARGVTVRGGDLDEAPQAYRRLPDVLKAHEGTIKIKHVLSPIGVAMAGRDVRDPYAD